MAYATQTAVNALAERIGQEFAGLDAGGGVGLRHNPRGPASDTDWYVYPDTLAPASSGTVTVTANRLYAVPISKALLASGITVYVATGASGQMRAGIFASDPDTGLPSTLLVEGNAAFSTSASATRHNIIFGSNYDLGEPAWLAIVFSGTPALRTGTAFGGIGNQTFEDSTGQFAGLYGSHTYGALPSTFPTIAGRLNGVLCPLMALKQVG